MSKATSRSRPIAASTNKENEAPTMERYARRAETMDRGEPIMSLSSKATSSSSTHRSLAIAQKQATSSSRDSALQSSRLPKDRNQSPSASSGKGSDAPTASYASGVRETSSSSRRIHEAEERPVSTTSTQNTRSVDEVVEELEQVQAQFDELREVRTTKPERLMHQWQSAAEAKEKETDEYIAELKRKIERLEQRSTMPGASEQRGSDAQVTALQREVGEARKREKALQEQLARQASEMERLQNQLATNTNTAARSHHAATNAGSTQLGIGDERAVRRLYEDLTGIVVNKVEPIEASEAGGMKDARRYHTIFACAGFYDLEIKLDESISDLPSTVFGPSSGPRHDLLYTPSFDADRDADLLQSGKLPEFLKDAIRFERATAVKFLSTLHKRLDRHAKRT